MRSSRCTTRSRALLAGALLAAAALLAQLPRPGVAPDTPWNCPPGHAIKGYMTTAARRIYYVPGDPFYDEASPERCYASEDEARRDGARPATGGGAPPPGTVQGWRFARHRGSLQAFPQ